VEYFDNELQVLVAKGKAQGYLTYDEVNDYLPDEDVSPEKLDNLLIALDDRGIDLVDEAPDEGFGADKQPTANESLKKEEEAPSALSEPDTGPRAGEDPRSSCVCQ
jgi:RNA polymerase primary sigma factor